jgi:DNA-binding winged helix-turn-helix (wHTH) protein
MEQSEDRTSVTPQSYCFGCHVLDLRRAVLLGPGGAELSLRPKAFDVLRCLVENAGRIVSREELLEAVWPGLHIDDDGITQCVREVRRALGDETQQVIRTIAKRGYLLDSYVYESTKDLKRQTSIKAADRPTQAPEPGVQVPEPNVPAVYAAFSGHWVGFWDNNPSYSTSLTIETVSLTGEVTGSYAFMSFPPIRIETKIIDSAVSFGSSIQFRFTLQLDNRLEGIRRDSGILNKTLLSKG